MDPLSLDANITIPSTFGASGMLFIFVLVVAFHLYVAYCLARIAKKTNTPNEWLAWVPIINIVLMVQIARLPLWVILGLLVPFLNILVGVFVWWKISEERRRPGWWGILMVISPINLIVIWLLAFKEAENELAPVSSSPPQSPAPPNA
ncbi:MAG TPA: hypothetical protein PKD79_00305 [Candidatus Doudnabacteria bacterium]|nr:hypothetical protein [Candidatus Doudnabacteria bacterium]